MRIKMLSNQFHCPNWTTIVCLKRSICTLTNNSMIHSNDNEQNSRRNNLRFRGLECCDGTTTVDTVLNFLLSDLGLGDITSNNIIAALPLPMTNKTVFDPDSNKSRNQTSHNPTMLVKFRNRMVKGSIIRKRSVLKGRKFTIYEDLTGMNMQLMNRLRNSERMIKSGLWNGKIFATLENNKTVAD